MTRPLQDLHLSSLEIFCEAVRQGGFSAAAGSLGLTPAAVSRVVKRLEERLGVPLFIRSTRHISLTREGQSYYDCCKAVLETLQEKERSLREQNQAPAGLLRVSAPETFSHHILLPKLRSFCLAYDGLNIDLQISNSNVDFTKEGFDLCIRLIRGQTILNDTLIERPLGTVSTGFYASKTYLDQFGEPQNLEDLRHHACIFFIPPGETRALPWHGLDLEHARVFMGQSQVRVFDSFVACREYALHHGGIAQLFNFCVAEQVQSGQLIPILKQVPSQEGWRFSILYASGKRRSAKIKAFADFVQRESRIALF